MDIDVTLQTREISYKPLPANFLLQDWVWPPLISAAGLQDKATWLGMSQRKQQTSLEHLSGLLM